MDGTLGMQYAACETPRQACDLGKNLIPVRARRVRRSAHTRNELPRGLGTSPDRPPLNSVDDFVTNELRGNPTVFANVSSKFDADSRDADLPAKQHATGLLRPPLGGLVRW